mgnify:FL=1|tara:strand:- start:3252 stop:4217 length:966 start_codon:yes stop_codon:yes gene_type:complete
MSDVMRQVIEAAKRSPQGVDIPFLGPDKKFPINLICNDDLEPSTSVGNRSVYTRWTRDGSGLVNLYVNHMALEALRDPTDLPKFIWLLESREIIPDQYKFIEDNYDYVASKVDGIFTCDQRLTEEVGEDGKFLYCMSNAAPWVKERDVYTKSKLVSMVASNKGYTEGHRRRLRVVEKFYQERGGDDLFGWGLPNELPLDDKVDAIKDYMFSFAVENANYPTYFTEKLTDCFACGTIPVYYGTAGVAQYFNHEGIIFLDQNQPWENIPWDKLTPEYYESKKDVIQENFMIALNMRVAEDYMYKNYFVQLDPLRNQRIDPLGA